MAPAVERRRGVVFPGGIMIAIIVIFGIAVAYEIILTIREARQ